ncbi:MAG: ribonuclease E/G [Pikeienuella sp.]
MTRLIVIQPREDEAGTMAALVEDGVLQDFYVDAPDDKHEMEDIHLVRIKRIIPKQGAAHVKMANGAKGFLREAGAVKEGQLVIAQVSGLASPDKGTPLTARRLHRGRYAILTPDAPGVNVARSIKDKDERARLTDIATPLIGEDGAGVIIRSAAIDADADMLASDITALMEVERAVVEAAAALEISLLAAAPDAMMRAWRDWPEPDEVIEESDAFDRLGLWDQIDALRTPNVALHGGGWMAIEPTTALIAIDVNTGGDLTPQAAANANLRTCADLPRQLRLRGLGGQITIDFAPMRKNDRKAVESALKKAFANDGVQTTFAGWTPLGHFEMLRKRERRPLKELLGG